LGWDGASLGDKVTSAIFSVVCPPEVIRKSGGDRGAVSLPPQCHPGSPDLLHPTSQALGSWGPG
jgi:hypothetical protein